jgi:2',3'-cyclic-nucleotide 2'-phosphodiesterase (5'-nucleotidase family)
LGAQQSPQTDAAAGSVAVTILHVNDTHGRTEPYTENGRSIGGYARLSTLVHDLRASIPAAKVFFIHAGDELSRGDDLTRDTLGQANAAVWNYLKLDAYVPGNGDFYDGADALFGMLGRMEFPILAANVSVRATGRPLGRPYVIEKAGPVRIAFLGLCFIKDESLDEFSLADAEKTALRFVPELRKQADVVVVISHRGALADRQLAAEIAGIDLIIGGHSHTVLPEGVRVPRPDGGETLVVQAGVNMQYLGKVDLRLVKSAAGYRVAESAAAIIPVDDKVRMDPAVTAILARFAEAGAPAPAAKP